MKKSYNALVDDVEWCGHPFVSLRTWTCADCARPVTDATRVRMEAAPTRARDGEVWLLLTVRQDQFEDRQIIGAVEGIFTDRAKIAALLIRRYIMEAAHIRDTMRRTHWYQGAFNLMLFKGWEEEPDERGHSRAYRLGLEKIDEPG